MSKCTIFFCGPKKMSANPPTTVLSQQYLCRLFWVFNSTSSNLKWHCRIVGKYMFLLDTNMDILYNIDTPIGAVASKHTVFGGVGSECICLFVRMCCGHNVDPDVIVYFVCLGHWITLHTSSYTLKPMYMNSLRPLGNVWWIKTKVKQSSLCTCKATVHTHISCPLFPYFYMVQEFAAPAVKYLRSYSVTENGVFTLLTVFGIQRNSWGRDGFSTNAYKQHKHKGYKIFMEPKQGWEVQCKQINQLYLLLASPVQKV